MRLAGGRLQYYSLAMGKLVSQGNGQTQGGWLKTDPRAGVVLVRVAPLKARGAESGSAGCHAAFEAEDECLSCGQPPKLPDFGTLGLP